MSSPSVVRMMVPDRTIEFVDLVRGPVKFAPEHVPDFVIVRGNGEPLYTLVNPVDDSLMRVTHVLRGEDLLPSTPRQIVLYQALEQLGIGGGRTPRFGHLPTVLGEGNRRLSKRDRGSGLAEYRQKGYLPEGLLNYLALLGWAIADDRDIFTLDEMVQAFDILRVNANPARFDAKKCEAINAAHIRMLPVAELAERLVQFLVAAGLVSDPPLPDERERLLGGDPADSGADQHPVGGSGSAGLPVRRLTTRSPSSRTPGSAQTRQPRSPPRPRRWSRSSRTTTPRSRPRCAVP